MFEKGQIFWKHVTEVEEEKEVYNKESGACCWQGRDGVRKARSECSRDGQINCVEIDYK